MNHKLDEFYNIALEMVSEDKKKEPNIKEAYWFPNDDYILIMELEEDYISSSSKFVEPYYFKVDDEKNIYSGLAVIRSDEFEKLELPEKWGSWDKARKLEFK